MKVPVKVPMNKPLARLSALALLVMAAVNASAEDGFEPPRTSWGDPVIEGFYTNNTDVPFERSRDLGTKAFYTEEEFQARREAAANRVATETKPGTTADVHYANEDFALTPGQNEMVASLATSIITYPADGRLPEALPSAQRRAEELRAMSTGGAYDDAQSRPLAERCIIWPHEGPPLRPVGYNTHVQITQTEDHVVLMSEMIHDARIIPLVSSKPDNASLPQWQGNSWGHWEGDTLVIETSGFRDEITPRGINVPMGPEGKVVERITRTGDETINYEFMVSDPTLWESGWGGEYPMMMVEGPMFEYACHEGNYGIANILSGAREDERKAREEQ